MSTHDKPAQIAESVACIVDEDGGVCGLESCPRCGARPAEDVRTSYGFDGLRDGVFPPIYIDRWCRWQAVPTEQLIGELRFWANHLEQRLSDGDGNDR